MSDLLRRIISDITEYFFYFSQSFYFSFGYFCCGKSGKPVMCK